MVSDGWYDSAVAHDDRNVTALDDPPMPGGDATSVTNIRSRPNYVVVPDWALSANDTDADGRR